MHHHYHSTEAKVVQTLQEDGVVVVLTDTLWGLSSLPNAAGALALRALKRRQKPGFILLTSHLAALWKWVEKPPPSLVKRLEAAQWGQTYLLPPNKTLRQNKELANLFVGIGGKVAVRYNQHPNVCRISSLIENEPVLLSTSANLSGAPALHSLKDILSQFEGLPALMPTKAPTLGAPSKVWDGETGARLR